MGYAIWVAALFIDVAVGMGGHCSIQDKIFLVPDGSIFGKFALLAQNGFELRHLFEHKIANDARSAGAPQHEHQ